jgi:hypothetical protein
VRTCYRYNVLLDEYSSMLNAVHALKFAHMRKRTGALLTKPVMYYLRLVPSRANLLSI